jgi:hypothetical protein
MQALEPGKLVVELRAGLRVAVRQVDASDEDAIDRRFDVAALRVVGVARQRHAGQNRLAAAREDGDSVPGLLPPPYRVIARLADGIGGKFRVGGFELLQAGDVGPRRLEPLQQVRQPPLDVVDVEGRNLHAAPVFRPSISPSPRASPQMGRERSPRLRHRR